MTVALPVAKQVTEVVEYTGISRAVDSVEIRARVEGFVSRLSMQGNEGKMVAAGDLLMEIDPRPFAAQLAGAEASPKVANAKVTSSIAVAEAKVESAQAEVAVSEAVILKARLDYEYTQVTTPISGRVGQRQVDLGELVGAGEPTLLTEVINYDPIYVYFTVSETDYEKHLREAADLGRSGAEMENEENKKRVLVGLSSEKGFPHEGRIDFAELKIDLPPFSVPACGAEVRQRAANVAGVW